MSHMNPYDPCDWYIFTYNTFIWRINFSVFMKVPSYTIPTLFVGFGISKNSSVFQWLTAHEIAQGIISIPTSLGPEPSHKWKYMSNEKNWLVGVYRALYSPVISAV